MDPTIKLQRKQSVVNTVTDAIFTTPYILRNLQMDKWQAYQV
jgi:hypothetical protein